MNAPSLSGFLELTEANFRLFDLGTQLRKLPESTLADIDSGRTYPLPYLYYAWIVIFIWNPEEPTQNSFWFLKLPLDEQGCVSTAVHSDLVNRLYKALQTTDEKEMQRFLTDHPYQFKPEAEKMAALHATVSRSIGLPASVFHTDAHDYYLGKTTNIRWQDIGLQGIADLIIRIKKNELPLFEKRLRNLETEPFIAIAQLMEHSVTTVSMTETLLSRVDINDLPLCNAILRGCSQSKAIKLANPLIDKMLINHSDNLEFLLIVITRYHHLFQDISMAIRILDATVQLTNIESFQKLVKHLTIQPELSSLIAKVFKSQALTENLANAIAVMIQDQRIRYERH